MFKIKSIIAVILSLLVLVLPSCKSSQSEAELKIGVKDIQGVCNPFYAESEGDSEVISQMFMSIQRRDGDNKLINYGGGISYEFVGDSQIKYTVSLNEDMFFSDGKNITIDDVIFFYHFIADATYDGIYSDWYFNDIVGLKEYYFDDVNYQDKILNIEKKIESNYSSATIETEDYVKYLVETNLEGRFNGNLDSVSPSGVTWKEYIGNMGYSDDLASLGSNPKTDDVIEFVATIEAENNRFSYNPKDWYRELLYKDYIGGNYSDGTDIDTIKGIKKVNDYTCTVLFNSRNINAVAQLNALLVPKEYFSTEYVKGSADKIKKIDRCNVGSGPYVVTDFTETEVRMSANEYYNENECEFTTLRFIELSDEDNPINYVVSGKVDVVETLATADAVKKLDGKNVRYFIEDCDYYVSLFLNTRTVDTPHRKSFIGLSNVNSAVESKIGSYYTRPLRPISVRFEEYPSDLTESYYSESTYSLYNINSEINMTDVSVYYCGSEEDLEFSVLEEYKNNLSQKGITLNIVLTDESSLENAIISGKADMWIETVYDGDSCDKLEYYNSVGRLNKTGISSPEIDKMTADIRSAAGFYDKVSMVGKLMDLVMAEAVESPLYQLQTITVYNTETISDSSFTHGLNIDGYTHYIPLLKKN